MHKIFYYIASSVLFALAARFAYLDKPWQVPGFFLAAAIIIMFLANIDKIASLTASRKGITLVTRAEALLREVQILAQYTAFLAMKQVQPSFWGCSPEQVDDMLCKTQKLLDELKLPITEELREEFIKTRAIVEASYKNAILQAITSTPKDTLKKQIASLRGAQSLRELIRREVGEACLTSFIEERLQDYAYFVEKKQHRNKDLWMRREQWGTMNTEHAGIAGDS